MTTEFAGGFCHTAPSHQNALDIFSGQWKSALPGTLNLKAGNTPTFDNTKVIDWIEKSLPHGLHDLSVLEIGPYEAYYTFQMETRGALKIVAIEVNRINYLKCLIMKEALGLKANFFHGDFNLWPIEDIPIFDFCMAAGVLYHQREPLLFLDRLTQISNCFYLWTHYYDDLVFQNKDSYPHFISDHNKVIHHDHKDYNLYYRSYLWKNNNGPPSQFSGGPQSFAFWMEKQDITAFIKSRGFYIKFMEEAGSHKAGPYLALLANKCSPY